MLYTRMCIVWASPMKSAMMKDRRLLLLSWLTLLSLTTSEYASFLHAATPPDRILSYKSSSELFPNGTGVTRSDFPEGFLFGAITSSMKHEGAQYEDNKTNNIWDVYATKEGSTIDGALPGQCGNNYHEYKEDHQLLVDMGMNSYRLSLSWSRILPNGSGEVNEVAISHYNDVIDNVLSKGLIPMVTLWTQDHPHILDVRYGGPLNAQFIEDFVTYAETCFKAFGDRVKFWVTFDEPNDWAGLGYSTNLFAPGRCTKNIIGQYYTNYGNCDEGNSGTEPYIVGHHLLLAHAKAVDIYRNKYQPIQNGSIGYALWFRWYEPLTNSTVDVEAAQRAKDFLVGWFLDPIFFGDYPPSMRKVVGDRLPNFTNDEIALVKGSLDFIGLTVQTAFYVYARNFYEFEDKFCYYLDWEADIEEERDGVKIGEVGEEDNFAVPWIMRTILEYIKDKYSNFPTFITQTGWGISYNYTKGFEEEAMEETLQDESRVDYFQTYYDELLAAIQEGANVKGVYAWSLIDGFEYNLGLGTRVGLYYVDRNLKRYPRKSAFWFKEMLSQNTNSTNIL